MNTLQAFYSFSGFVPVTSATFFILVTQLSETVINDFSFQKAFKIGDLAF